MAKAYVYVDGFNLYYGLIEKGNYKWLNIDQLCKLLFPSDDILKIKYFTANVKARNDPQRPLRQQVYFRALRTIPYLEIYRGTFLTKKKRVLVRQSNPPSMVWVDSTQEKGTDVSLATHLLCDAFNKCFDLAIVISNDSDLCEPIKVVTQDLKFPVSVLNPHKRNSVELTKVATFIKEIRSGPLGVSQFPPTMVDAKGPFTKPPIW